MKPSSDPKADQLVNSNISQPQPQPQSQTQIPNDNPDAESNVEIGTKTGTLLGKGETPSIMNIPINELLGKGE